jgi:NIMA (never in mitosis gene a)-related kinase
MITAEDYHRDVREIKTIGSGSFGSALLIEYANDQFVAKKITLEHLLEEEKHKALNEASLLRALHHPHITECVPPYFISESSCRSSSCPSTARHHRAGTSLCRYFGSFVSSNVLFIIMEYCGGGSLQQAMSRRERANETFDEEEVFDWFLQIGQALEFVHARKILHRDIKTSNVFLTKRNMVKLGDFGIARQMDDTTDFAKTVVGTPYYLSPEVIEGRPYVGDLTDGGRDCGRVCSGRRALFDRYNHLSDVWALGVLLYQMVALRCKWPRRPLAPGTGPLSSSTTPPHTTPLTSPAAHNLVRARAALFLHLTPFHRPHPIHVSTPALQTRSRLQRSPRLRSGSSRASTTRCRPRRRRTSAT